MRAEHRLTINLERLSKTMNLLLLSLLVASSIYTYTNPSIWKYIVVGFLSLINVINFYYLYIQKAHTLLSNFGVLAQIRYLVESLGPEFRQYLYSSDAEGRPFNRTERADVYQKSKENLASSAFGSLLNFTRDEMKFKHSFYPTPKNEIKSYHLSFGESRGIANPYHMKNHLMIGAMSFGALGSKAVQALARGAKKAGIIMNTGEGGYPKYHLTEGCDLIFQMGTAKFGVRTPDGQLDKDKLEALAAKNEIKMIEIKFSQGAKPGKGGILPKEKITKEIAELRGIPMGQDVVSPPYHSECIDEKSTCYFIKQIQEISKIPVGIKFCLGREMEFLRLIRTMKSLDIFPDFISLDGAEGGTGAAPQIFMDHVGWPIFESLPLVDKVLKEEGVRNKIRLIASGKLISTGKQMMALALGADAIYTARGFMMAIGCIQALRCNNNTCPVGITTHSPHLMRGLDIEEKSNRVESYVYSLNHDYQELLSALGKKSLDEIQEDVLLTYNQKNN